MYHLLHLSHLPFGHFILNLLKIGHSLSIFTLLICLLPYYSLEKNYKNTTSNHHNKQYRYK